MPRAPIDENLGEFERSWPQLPAPNRQTLIDAAANAGTFRSGRRMFFPQDGWVVMVRSPR